MGYFYGLFVRGIDVRDEIRGLPVTPLEPINYHITILYIGDRKPGKEVGTRIYSALSKIPCFSIELGEPILLPSEAKPRVLALSVIDKGSNLVRIRNALLNVMNDLGIELRDRFLGEFKPHITVGYIRSKVDSWYLRQLLGDLRIGETRPLLIREVSLIHAHEGSYSLIENYELPCNESL